MPHGTGLCPGLTLALTGFSFRGSTKKRLLESETGEMAASMGALEKNRRTMSRVNTNKWGQCSARLRRSWGMELG